MVSAANINLQIADDPFTPLCPPLLLRNQIYGQVQQPGLPGLQCSHSFPSDIRWCSPPPHPGAAAALHLHILVQSGEGASGDRGADVPFLDFMQHFANCENGFIISLLGCE